MRTQPHRFPHIFHLPFQILPDFLIREASASKQIAHRRKGRHPGCSFFCQQMQCLFFHEKSMFQTVNARFQCLITGLIAIAMSHDRHTSVMSGTDHPANRFPVKTIFCQCSRVGKIQNPADHNLDKISTFLFCSPNKCFVFFPCVKWKSHNTAVMMTFMNGKHRRTIINPILRRQFFCLFRRSARISAIPHKGYSGVFPFLKMSTDCCLADTIFMKCHCCFIINSVHNYMGMTFSQHCFRLLFLSVFPVMHFFQKK